MLLNIMLTSIMVMMVSNVKAESSSCQAMADKLNKRWMVGANRFDAGGATGEEARDLLMEWIGENGILTTKCTPVGYPEVYGPCTDGYIMDHVAASWVGLTDRAKELVEEDKLLPFPVFPTPGIGLVFNTSSAETKVMCSYPSDGASDGRMDKGCGPRKEDYYFGSESNRPMVEQFLHDQATNTLNMTNKLQVQNFVRQYNDSVSTWQADNWEDTGRTWEDFTCREWANTNDTWSAFGPKNTSSMDACKAYTQDPSNVWNPEVTHMGSFFYYLMLGGWNDTLAPLLGHPSCKDTMDACASNGSCMGYPVEWVGACSWPPEDFQSAMDMWLELRSRANPLNIQMNEVELDLEANGPGNVEAIYTVNTPYTVISQKEVQDFFLKMGEPGTTSPENITEYYKYAADKLAKEFYGDIPVVTLNPTKEDALAGTLFSCD